MKTNYTTVNISTITILKVLAVILMLWFLFAVRDIILLFLIAIIISSAIDPLADYLSKKKIPRALSVLIVYIIFLGIVSMIVSLIVPPISEQIQSISQSDFYSNFVSRIGGLQDRLHGLGIDASVTDSFQQYTNSLSQGLFNTGRNILNGFVSVVTVLAISFYLTAEPNGMKNFVKHLLPFKYQTYAFSLVTKIQSKIGSWVLGQLILSFVIFAVTYVGLLILGVDYALVLALIAGLLEIVPYIGPIIAIIPAVFFAFIQDPPLAVAVVILYLVIQQLENHLLVPMIMSRSVGINPILVILSVLVGSSLGGLLGAVIAVPVVSGLMVFIHDFMNRDDISDLEEKIEA